jgi:hypothetical protein
MFERVLSPEMQEQIFASGGGYLSCFEVE